VTEQSAEKLLKAETDNGRSISDMSKPRNGTPEQDMYKGMRRMVFFIMILVPLIPFILVLGIGYYYFTSSLQTNTLATVNRIVEDHRQMIETFLRERRANLEFVVNSYSYADLTEPEKSYISRQSVGRMLNGGQNGRDENHAGR